VSPSITSVTVISVDAGAAGTDGGRTGAGELEGGGGVGTAVVVATEAVDGVGRAAGPTVVGGTPVGGTAAVGAFGTGVRESMVVGAVPLEAAVVCGAAAAVLSSSDEEGAASTIRTRTTRMPPVIVYQRRHQGLFVVVLGRSVGPVTGESSFVCCRGVAREMHDC
jgi:hypothetical protein